MNHGSVRSQRSSSQPIPPQVRMAEMNSATMIVPVSRSPQPPRRSVDAEEGWGLEEVSGPGSGKALRAGSSETIVGAEPTVLHVRVSNLCLHMFALVRATV